MLLKNMARNNVQSIEPFEHLFLPVWYIIFHCGALDFFR